MRKSVRPLAAIMGFLGFLVLILDSKTAIKGGMDGIQMCLNALIPSLFPFMFLNYWTSSRLTQLPLPFLRPLGKLCGIPSGGEAFMLTAFLGGYPIGAQNIYQLWKNKTLNTATAKRLLGFCNLAGPSFIFGVLGQVFMSAKVCFLLWLIQILSAISVALILPGKDSCKISPMETKPVSMTTALELSIKGMSKICGWAVLFRVVASVLDRWVLWALEPDLTALVNGFLELSNGCLMLTSLDSKGISFVLASIMLSFGGLCVYMQTCSVTKELGSGSYLYGKLLQSLIATILSILFLPAVAPDLLPDFIPLLLAAAVTLAVSVAFLYRKKIIVAFSVKRLYNHNI